MKKLSFLFAILLTGCCAIGQIPPQFLPMTEDCGAAMPNYIPKFAYTDNCGIDTVWQSPTRMAVANLRDMAHCSHDQRHDQGY